MIPSQNSDERIDWLAGQIEILMSMMMEKERQIEILKEFASNMKDFSENVNGTLTDHEIRIFWCEGKGTGGRPIGK